MDSRSPTLSRRLKLRDLELIVVLDDVRNLNRAARLQHTSQPALSRALAQLESALGLALFERSARGMTPTPYGECLIRYARQCLATLERAADDLGSLQAGGMGHVNIGTNYSSAAYLLPRAITRLHHEAPGVMTSVREGPLDALLTDLRSRRVDLIVARLSHDTHDAGFLTTPLLEEPMCLVSGLHHPLASKTSLGWPDLLAYPWILPPRNTPVRERLGTLLREQDLPWPQSQVESASILVNTVLLQTSEVLSITPLAVARHQSAQGLLHLLDFTLPPVFAPLGLIQLRDHPPTPAQQAMIACIAREVATLSP